MQGDDAMRTGSLCFCFSALAVVSLNAHAETRIAAKPGLWTNESSMQGPDGSTTAFRNGRMYVNGKDMTPAQLSAEDIAAMAADAQDCLTTNNIPTVEEFVANFQREGSDEGTTWSEARVIEATANKIVFVGQFTTRFMAEKPYSGDTRCDVKIAGELMDVACNITWRTPPHSGKVSKLTSKSKRIAPICTPKPDSDQDAAETTDEPEEPQESL
jgi:hypothetical protein